MTAPPPAELPLAELPPPALPHPGALAGPPVPWAALRRVLVVRADNLGDVLMTGPALRALRRAAPEARITLLTSPGGAAAAPLLPEVDDLVVVSPSWQLAGPAPAPDRAAELALVDRLAAGRYDAAVVLTSFSQSPWPVASLLHLAEVPVRVGTSKEFGGALLSHWVPAPGEGLHQVDRALHLLAAVGVEGDGTDLRVRVPAEGRAAAAAELAGLGVAPSSGYAVLLPGASCSSRRWEPARFARVAALLAGSGRPVVVAGPEREGGLVAEVVAAAAAPGGSGPAPGAAGPTPAGHAPVVGLVGRLDVAGLAGLLETAGVAVVNNSGGMHLADALRTPLVVLFAGTEEEGQYRPRSTAGVLFRRPTTCSPCRAFVCPYAHECLDVDPDEVAAAATRLAAPRRAAA